VSPERLEAAPRGRIPGSQIERGREDIVSWNPIFAASGRQARATPRQRRPAVVLVWAVALLFSLVAGPAQALPDAADDDGFNWQPSLYWKQGDLRLDLMLETRYRVEWWDAHKGQTDDFHALRTRVGAKFSYKSLFSLFAEFQDSRIYDLSANTSGAGTLYQRYSKGGDSDHTDGQDLRQAWLDLRPIEGLSIRGGRMDIKLGTQAMYAEPNWKYLKIKRASQRMVGTVGWTHGERTNHGGSVAYDTGGYHLYFFGAQPTTGVFDIRGAYKNQPDIAYGGASLTAKRGTWLRDTELRGFFLGYSDNRPVDDGGKPEEVRVYTLGFSAIGVYPCGPGNFDVFAWAAGQAGKFDGRDHWAGAGILELGYQLPKVMAKPWFRAGVNVASGGDATGDHNTFFNMLPTNHMYYGFADAFAFQNLLDVFGQLMLKPHEKVGLNFMVHHFRLVDSDDAQYFGTGAFTKKVPAGFGYGSNFSYGKHEVGTEIDVAVNVKLHKHVSLQGGYSFIWGGDVWEAKKADGGWTDSDVEFGYLQIALKY
jgi:hypothetical protein